MSETPSRELALKWIASMKAALITFAFLAACSFDAHASENGLANFMRDYNDAKADPKAILQYRCWSAEESENHFHVKNHCQDMVLLPCDQTCDGWKSFMILTEDGVSEHLMCLQAEADHKACVGVGELDTKYFVWNDGFGAWEISDPDKAANEELAK